MKKFVCVLMASALLLFTGCSSKPDSSTGDADTVRIGCKFAYVPYNWEEDSATEYNAPIENHDGFYGDGYDVQIAKRVAEAMGKEPVFVKVSFDGLMQALDHGQIDMVISGMLDSPEHRQAADFSNTYAVAKTEYTVLVNQDSSYAGATALEELSGASILGQRGTRLDTVINQIRGVSHISPVDTIPAMLDRLLKGTVDGIVINRETVEVYTSQYEELTGLTFEEGEGFELDFSGICVGVRKGDTELLEAVNAALDEISEADRTALFDAAMERGGA